MLSNVLNLANAIINTATVSVDSINNVAIAVNNATVVAKDYSELGKRIATSNIASIDKQLTLSNL